MTRKFFYIKSTSETKIFFLIFIFIYATIIQFSIYPFIVTADGMTRIRLVDTIINGNISDANSLLPFFPVLIQYIMFKIAENHALFSFTQIILSILASYFLLRRFIDSFSSYTVLILSFPFLIFFAIQTDSALIYISLVFAIDSYLRYRDTQKTKYLIYFSILLCISALIRPNAIPLSLIVIFLIFYHNKKIGIFYIILLFSVFFVNKNNFFTYEQKNPLSLVFVYDIVGFLDSQSTNLNKYREVFDHDFGAGTTQNLLNRFNSCCLNSLVWDNNPPLPAYKISEIENYKKIKDIYIYIWKKEPYKMLIHKVNQSLWTLGISKELLNIKRGIHYFDINSKKYGGLETSYQNKYRNVFFSTIDKFHYITYRPYILIVIFSSLVLICFYLKMESSIYYLAVGSIAIIYYLSFLPFTQAYEFRYFAPTFYILFFSSIGILATLFINFVKRRKIKV